MDTSTHASTRAATLDPPVLGRLSSLAEPTRCRMLLVLVEGELSVGELCQVLQLPQSTVSRHLKVLVDHGWLATRRDGTSHYYRFEVEGLEEEPLRLWQAVRESLQPLVEDNGDRGRLATVVAARRGLSQAFFAGGAGTWDALRDELFGASFELAALPALLAPDLELADLACGTGRVAEVLAPFVARVVAIDDSPAMLAAARGRLGRASNVDLREGALEQLPLADQAVDAATLVLALHLAAEPARVLAEAARVLRPAGRLLIVDLVPHEREDLRRQLGHVWLGFDRDRLGRHCTEAGLRLTLYRPLPRSSAASGPALFVALATPTETSSGTTASPNPAGEPA